MYGDLRSPRILFSLVLITLVVVVSLLADVLAPFDPLAMDTQAALQPPGTRYLLGTDEYGRDILSRLMFGARPSLVIALGSVVFAAVAGVPLGLLGAYWKGWPGQSIMRLVDVTLFFPPIFVALAAVGLLGPGMWTLTLVIGLLQAPRFSRQTFGSALEINVMEYVEAMRALGAGDTRILVRHVFPNVLAPLIVLTSLSFAAAILLESGLSFLGLGVVPPTPSWGQMIGAARAYMMQSPGYVLWPSLALALLILAMNSFGEWLRDSLDPRFHGRR